MTKGETKKFYKTRLNCLQQIKRATAIPITSCQYQLANCNYAVLRHQTIMKRND